MCGRVKTFSYRHSSLSIAMTSSISIKSALLLMLCYLYTVVASDNCAVSGDDFCRCSTANLTLDIRHIGLSYPASTATPDDKYALIYTPCSPEVCKGNTGEASVVCQTQNNNDVSFSLGRYTNFKWTVTTYTPLEFEIHYGGGDTASGTARTSVVTFKSGSGSTQFSYDRENDKTFTYYFNVVGSSVVPYSRGGSSNGGTIAGPIGIVIIVLALGGFIAYFMIGGIFMYTQRGARGMEVIPNYTFWKDFPFLIKDGFLFIISPCYKRSEKYQGL